MANAFDVANAPEGEPKEIVVGDFIQWKRTDLESDYPAALYTATYIARSALGVANEFTTVMTAYVAAISSSASSAYAKGDYQWQLEILRNSDSERVIIDRGTFTVLADLDVEDDPRTHATIMLGKIESLLSGKADSDVAQYSIAGRSLTKLTFTEMLEARDYYRNEAAREKAVSNAKQGRRGGATVKVRL